MARIAGLFYVILTLSISCVADSSVFDPEEIGDLQKWFQKHNLIGRKKQAMREGCYSVINCVDIWGEEENLQTGVPKRTGSDLHNAAKSTKQELLFTYWLHKNGLRPSKDFFTGLGITKLDDIQKIKKASEVPLKGFICDDQYNALASAIATLPQSDEEYKQLASLLWQEVLAEEARSWGTGLPLVLALVLLIVPLFLTTYITMFPVRRIVAFGGAKLSFLSLLTGKSLSPKSTVVDFLWTEPQRVGNTICFKIRFYQRNGQPYPICDSDNLFIEIARGNNTVAFSVELGGEDPSDVNTAKVLFSVRRSGEYNISVLVNMVHVYGSPFKKTFLPEYPDPQKTGFINHCSTVICSEKIPSQLFLEPRDKYGNPCNIQESFGTADFNVSLMDVKNMNNITSDSVCNWHDYPALSRKALLLQLPNKGIYCVTVRYKNEVVQNGDFYVIVLNESQAAEVQKYVTKKSVDYTCERMFFNNKVHLDMICRISPKQLAMSTAYKFLGFCYRKTCLVSFRVCPSTKLKFEETPHGETALLIRNGPKSGVKLITKDIDLIAAIFTQFLLRNIGGSETFSDKQDFFHHEVRRHHQKRFHDKLGISIQRERILENSFQTMRRFTASDWCKSFEISFIGEEGLDWGGLRREWCNLVCTALFSPTSELFHSFKIDNQGLVHPLPQDMRPEHFKSTEYFNFAGKIVGKCLYESSLGSSYRQLVKAKFSRSFLAQIIGLSVHYKYFEYDDPELYIRKVEYIIKNDPKDIDLTFTDEAYINGRAKEVELVQGGKDKQVTNLNKLDYLNALAEYRLCTSVKAEIEAFINGLSELIPIQHLSIFDENELELLICGTDTYSIADFKANHVVTGSSFEFKKVLDWFWTTVSNFTNEEMARLLQFTTGCSQLPPGGFAELNPKFQISPMPSFGNLPTAHTCFNQLCLPIYDSYEQFEKALQLAITEGSEGFGLI